MKTYREEYKQKTISPQAAADLVQTGHLLDYGQFCCKPIAFDAALGERTDDDRLSDVYVRCSCTVLPVPQIVIRDPQQTTFRYNSTHFSAIDRKLADAGLCSYIPIHYHETQSFYYREGLEHLWPDIWVAQVAPMDNHGMFNFGIANVVTRVTALTAKIRIVEVNENLPRCLGGQEESIHISEVDYIIEGNNPPVFALPPSGAPTAAELRIAELIVEEIRDGACLQLGIGALPNAIGSMIADSDLKDLGIQSEMFCDAMVMMYEKGRITNAKKRMDRGKSTFSFCLGTPETYEFIDDNPQLASCCVERVNDPMLVRMNDRAISINNILEIDLFSQICSESKGTRQISGTGGQLDFSLGAFESNGGKNFLAFSSTYTDKEGQLHSRIRPMLAPGSIVTVPRSVAHWIVTENGKFNMKGLSVWERAERLILLAHPDFRDSLIKEAEAMKIWRPSNRL